MVINVNDKVLNDIKINLYYCKDTLSIINSACVSNYDFTFITGPLTIVANQLLESVRVIDELLGTNNLPTGETVNE